MWFGQNKIVYSIYTKNKNMFLNYYLICLAYCLYMSFRKWNRDVMEGGLGISPGLESIGLIFVCWVLAPVDIFLTWTRIYKEAEEARRRESKRKL
jgi:hypothetical protein